MDFFWGLITKSIRNNKYLYNSYFSGILKISKKEILPNVDNLDIIGIDNSEFNKFYGFSEKDV